MWFRYFRLTLSVLAIVAATVVTNAQVVVPNSDGIDARADAGAIASRLASPDAIERQTAAEALATLAAVNQKKLLEGYRVQEKNKRVRLALDWALYRIGKSEAFFQIVRELDSGRHDQAVGYLSQLDTPVVLHDLLKRETNEPRITAGVLEALARIGNAESLDLIKPFRDSFARDVSSAAETAIDAIEARLLQRELVLPSRPRTVSKTEESPSP
jgi:hypothetical protein